jgi:single-strand DNA-binding protein
VAANLNKVFLIGNLTRDPELRYLTTGRAVTSFSIACNRAFTTQSGEKKEEVTFIRIVTWEKRAEVCNEYLKKGSPVFIEGRLQSRTWEAQDGSKRSTVEVVASNVQFLPRSGGASVSKAADSEIETTAEHEEASQTEGGVVKEDNEKEVPF